ncbi:hypothetical protein EYR38_008742 [Pleurotus pulmonarius]|nr:hypothetical protein EYR38_008742 [Pleurotus pulmonarius]
MFFKFALYLTFLVVLSSAHPGQLRSRQASKGCYPLHTTFSNSEVSNGGNTLMTIISPADSYSTSASGLELFLKKPAGRVTTHNGVNDQLGSGATANSSFLLSYGKVSFDLTAPTGASGAVVAAIFISDDHHEIDIELLTGDPKQWQTNVFAPPVANAPPAYGKLSSVEDIPKSRSGQQTIGERHSYSIDWNPRRIIWSVDGRSVRTLTPQQSRINGRVNYPTSPMRIQLGIWDASSPEGTSEWAQGPINWNRQPEKLIAKFHSLTVECP